jgi:uncharacterized membrane protein YdfJ with MMPL/SSD domain
MLLLLLAVVVVAHYDLLLIARSTEEMHARLTTGGIRAMAGIGDVVTAASLMLVPLGAGQVHHITARWR